MKEKETKEAIGLAKREGEALMRELLDFGLALAAFHPSTALATRYIMLQNRVVEVHSIFADVFRAIEAALAEKGGSL